MSLPTISFNNVSQLQTTATSSKSYTFSTFTLEPGTKILKEVKHRKTTPLTFRNFVHYYHDTDTYNELLVAVHHETCLLYRYFNALANTADNNKFIKLFKLTANLSKKILRAEFFLAATWIHQDEDSYRIPMDFPFQEPITEISYNSDSFSKLETQAQKRRIKDWKDKIDYQFPWRKRRSPGKSIITVTRARELKDITARDFQLEKLYLDLTFAQDELDKYYQSTWDNRKITPSQKIEKLQEVINTIQHQYKHKFSEKTANLSHHNNDLVIPDCDITHTAILTLHNEYQHYVSQVIEKGLNELTCLVNAQETIHRKLKSVTDDISHVKHQNMVKNHNHARSHQSQILPIKQLVNLGDLLQPSTTDTECFTSAF
jgi:hypothetical protein